MFQNPIIENGARFAGFTISRKMSANHDGEREVYDSVNSDGCRVALTVYDTASPRYAPEEGAEATEPDSISEICFFKTRDNAEKAPRYPRFLDCGVSEHAGKRYAWMAQEFVEGESVNDVLARRQLFTLTQTLTVIRNVAGTIDTLHSFRNGYGHFNVSASNILVRMEGDKVADARLIGFAHAGDGGNRQSQPDDGIDRRFRAPETLRGIFSTRADIYALGMVATVMLAGFPDKIAINSNKNVGFSGRDCEMEGIPPEQYRNAIRTRAAEKLGINCRTVLARASDPLPFNRPASAGLIADRLGRAATADRNPKSRESDRTSANGTERSSASAKSTCRKPAKPRDKQLGTATESRTSGVATQCSPKSHALDDVAGMTGIKNLLRRDFITIVRNPAMAKAYGIHPGNCTLLYGPQGCGKTFIAEKTAQEAGLKYKIVNPSDLGSIYIHGTQEKIASIFAEAEKEGPMILIFDEFDALVPNRESDRGGNQANEVNEMLTQLNNCASRGVYVIATTNRPTLIDPAILRKGRVDRTIYVAMPDRDARAELFRIETSKRPADSIDCYVLADATDGYACSDITFIVEETSRRCFEKTLNGGLDTPVPLTMERLKEVIADTVPSVTEAQRREYLELKARFDDRASGRSRVGFAL